MALGETKNETVSYLSDPDSETLRGETLEDAAKADTVSDLAEMPEDDMRTKTRGDFLARAWYYSINHGPRTPQHLLKGRFG